MRISIIQKKFIIEKAKLDTYEVKLMDKLSKIYIAGHKGMVGSAIMKKLYKLGHNNVIYKTHLELDLTDQAKVDKFFATEKIEYVFLAAAKVGGIWANKRYPADFIIENLLIECNVIRASYKNSVKKLLFLASSSIYPRECPQPIKEEYLLSGLPEPSNEAYTIAKISGLKMCQYFNTQYNTNYISLIPANLYGDNDNFDLESSHVLPAMIRKIYEAKINKKDYIEVWGTGKPLREFVHVDDLADACIFLMNNYNSNDFYNIGCGKDVSIAELAEIIKKIIDYSGYIKFNTEKPDGTYRKLLDVSKINEAGWKCKIDLEKGIKETYEWFLKNYNLVV